MDGEHDDWEDARLVLALIVLGPFILLWLAGRKTVRRIKRGRR